MEDLTKDLKYYAYYYESYQAVLGGFVGNYSIEVTDADGNKAFEPKYGLKAFYLLLKIIVLVIMMILVILDLMGLKGLI